MLKMPLTKRGRLEAARFFIMKITLLIMEESWKNHGILFLNFCGNPVISHWALYLTLGDKRNDWALYLTPGDKRNDWALFITPGDKKK